ncbi:MAG: hypothetical protein KGM49_01275 [Sphingomonadales bacterium]|nr:hypothetical protein [Sphingomonadales bacterium]
MPDAQPVQIEAAASTAEQVKHFDLAKVPAPPPGKCGSSDGEIVVCAQDPSRYRLKPLPDTPDEPPFGRAQTTIGGVDVGVHTESTAVGGFTSKRLMAGAKIKF